eukprot:COSAG01_NODE_978_length_12357_cov_10.838554_4_plen_202_part_00
MSHLFLSRNIEGGNAWSGAEPAGALRGAQQIRRRRRRRRQRRQRQLPPTGDCAVLARSAEAGRDRAERRRAPATGGTASRSAATALCRSVRREPWARWWWRRRRRGQCSAGLTHGCTTGSGGGSRRAAAAAQPTHRQRSRQRWPGSRRGRQQLSSSEGESFPCVHWVAVPQALRARRANRRCCPSAPAPRTSRCVSRGFGT